MTKWVQIIGHKEFATAVLDPSKKAFIIYVPSLSLGQMTIYLAREVQIASLIAKKVTVPVEYSNYANVFLKEVAMELPKYLDINKYAINLEPGKQPSYGLIYNLNPVKFKTLKSYIKTNLINGFI